MSPKEEIGDVKIDFKGRKIDFKGGGIALVAWFLAEFQQHIERVPGLSKFWYRNRRKWVQCLDGTGSLMEAFETEWVGVGIMLFPPPVGLINPPPPVMDVAIRDRWKSPERQMGREEKPLPH